MSRRQILLWVVGILIVVGLGLLSIRISGIAIRNAGQGGSQLQLSEPVERGISGVRVAWTVSAGVANSPVELVIRDGSGERVLGTAAVGDREMRVEFPCDVAGPTSLLLRDTRTSLVIAQKVVRLADPGRDCALR